MCDVIQEPPVIRIDEARELCDFDESLVIIEAGNARFLARFEGVDAKQARFTMFARINELPRSRGRFPNGLKARPGTDRSRAKKTT